VTIELGYFENAQDRATIRLGIASLFVSIPVLCDMLGRLTGPQVLQSCHFTNSIISCNCI